MSVLDILKLEMADDGFNFSSRWTPVSFYADLIEMIRPLEVANQVKGTQNVMKKRPDPPPIRTGTALREFPVTSILTQTGWESVNSSQTS